MRPGGRGGFAGELARFAAGHADPRVTAIAERTAAPQRVAVRGRRGVGRSTVARALASAGAAANLSVTADPDGDVVVYVSAEVLKPEDTRAIAAAPEVVVVLNKADLLPGGPLPAARRRCAELSSVAGAPVAPMIAPLALAALDGLDAECWAGLRALAAHPGADGLDGSHAGFLAAGNSVPAERRLRLLDALDLFGVAVGVAALRRGRTPAQVRALLRRLSGVDAVVRRVAAAGAEQRYRRVLDAVADLEALAVPRDRGAERVGAFLRRDDTVLARMEAAAEMAGAAGLEPRDPAGDAGGDLPRALRWQRYGRAAVSDLHRACGADIARGSLRLWSRAGGAPGECR